MLEQLNKDVLGLLLAETPARTDGLKIREDTESGDFMYILAFACNDMITLNRGGKEIFRMCDGDTTVEQITQKLYESNPAGSYMEVLESVLYCIRDMQKKGILYKGSAHILKELGVS